MNWMHFILAGSLLSGAAVGIGAFAAHGLKSILSPEKLAIFEVGVRYHFYHALALLIVGVIATRVDAVALKIAAYCFVFGVILFSGSLYTLALTQDKNYLGMITPFGGVLFILGWLLVAWSMVSLMH